MMESMENTKQLIPPTINQADFWNLPEVKEIQEMEKKGCSVDGFYKAIALKYGANLAWCNKYL